MNERNERKATWLIILFTVILAASALGSVSGQSTLRSKQEQLLNALIKVESNGNDKAIGDKGKAIGCLQIHRVYWVDAVERSGLGGNYVDCMRRDYSKCVVRAYMNRHGGLWWKTMDGFNAKKIARIHNGGPKGYKKKATISYWKKVRKVLAK
tara:strand:+ start:226 stop:684 length:459 start_codon:yes stop_codon:yes gene_type:complete